MGELVMLADLFSHHGQVCNKESGVYSSSVYWWKYGQPKMRLKVEGKNG